MDEENLNQDLLFEDLITKEPDDKPIENGDPQFDEEGNPVDPKSDHSHENDNEPTGKIPVEDKDNDNDNEPVKKVDGDSDAPGNGKTIEEVDDEGKDTNTVNLSGIEQYLSQFDIEGGIIQFEDGDSTHFDELEPDKQAEILSQLHLKQTSSIEDKYGLDQNEIGIINHLRQNNISIDAMVNNLAEERVQTILATQNKDSVDFDKMPDDSVYMNFLKNSNPESTADQLEQDLETAKKQTNYANVVSSIRGQFKSQQDSDRLKIDQDNAIKQSRDIDTQRQQVIESVINMSEIDGIALNDGTKNGVLDQVLEVNEYGDSLFMAEVFGDPKSLFRAAFWYNNGADILKSRDEYWKKEKSAAYKRGRESALGKQDPKISFTSKNTKTQNNNKTPSHQQEVDYIEQDELYV